MIRATLLVSLFALIACDTNDQLVLENRDMAEDTCAKPNSDGAQVAGRLTLIDEITTPKGGRLYVEGCENATPPVGATVDDLTKTGFSLVIPKAFYDAGVFKYLIVDGTYMSTKSGGTLQPIWFAPRVKMDGGLRTQSTFFHGVMGTMRDRIATELLAAGKIASVDAGPSFGTKFTYAYGWLALYDGFTINNVQQTTFSLDSTSNPGGNADASTCSLMNNDNNCCLFYSDSTFDDAFGPSMKPLLNFSATKSTSGFFAIVCRDDRMGDEKPEMTVTPGGSATDQGGKAVDVATMFGPFQVPRKRDAHVIVDNWHLP